MVRLTSGTLLLNNASYLMSVQCLDVIDPPTSDIYHFLTAVDFYASVAQGGRYRRP